MQTFPFSPPMNLIKEGKWLLGVNSPELTKSGFDTTDENNRYRFQHHVVGTPKMVKNLLTS